jgi:Abortive infection alpha
MAMRSNPISNIKGDTVTDPTTESAKAVQEMAKATGKGIDAAREAGGFIAKYINGPLEEASGIWTDKLKYLRWEQQLALMSKANEKLRQLGMSSPTRTVPLSLAIPILQEGSMQGDSELQERWANLLVNAANADNDIEIKTSYISILKDLSSADVRNLAAIYSLPFEKAQTTGVWPGKLPEKAEFYAQEYAQLGLPQHIHEALILSLANLTRLGCISAAMGHGGGQYFSHITPTVLGKHFVAACTLQGKRTNARSDESMR